MAAPRPAATRARTDGNSTQTSPAEMARPASAASRWRALSQAVPGGPATHGRPGLTVRTWSATADSAGAEDYLLRRDLGEDGTTELTAHTFWETLAAIRAFAAGDITVAIVEPQAQAMLLDFDRTAAHRSVVVDARG